MEGHLSLGNQNRKRHCFSSSLTRANGWRTGESVGKEPCWWRRQPRWNKSERMGIRSTESAPALCRLPRCSMCFLLPRGPYTYKHSHLFLPYQNIARLSDGNHWIMCCGVVCVILKSEKLFVSFITDEVTFNSTKTSVRYNTFFFFKEHTGKRCLSNI